ncbi:MAG TPA: hypothetical protein VEC75_06475 [Stellaceae bacterium]|nr:hypothetical protein [Stellaceae bacterium]
MPNDDLRQADLSHLSVREMSPAQRAELKRRYATFIANFGPATTKLPVAKRTGKPKRWVPGKTQ